MPEQMTLDEERQERSQHLVSRCDMSIEDIKSEIDFILGQPKREWVGLTDEEILEIKQDSEEFDYLIPHLFARSIEAKLKEKNHAS